jgi:hypothetical protein
MAAAALLWACAGGEDTGEEARDLSLAPAESLAVLDDQPAAQPQPQPTPPPSPAPSRPAARRQPTPPPTPAPAPPPAPAPAPLSLSQGTVIELVATDSVSNDTHQAGDRVTATGTAAIRAADGSVAIPAGAVFTGTVTEINAGEGRLILAFNHVSFGGQTYALEASTDSLALERRTDQFKAGDAAKIGAGAVVGAVAGRLLGKNTRGAIIGGAAGAAAGTGIALATRGDDIVLPAGGRIRIVLTAPMVLEPVS